MADPEGLNPTEAPIEEVPELSEEEITALREEEKELSKLERQVLRESLGIKDPKRAELKQSFGLGEYEKNPALKAILENEHVDVEGTTGRVDKTKHKSKPENLPEYVLAAQKVETYYEQLSPRGKRLFNKNKEIINRIKELDSSSPDLKDSEEWEAIIDDFGRKLTRPRGALNFLLAFNRGTSEQVLKKIDNGDIIEGFQIKFKIGGKWNAEDQRGASIEIYYPESIVALNEKINENISGISEIASSDFWETTPTDEMLETFGPDTDLENLRLLLIDNKEGFPEIFNYFPRYQGILDLLDKYKAKFQVELKNWLALEDFWDVIDEDTEYERKELFNEDGPLRKIFKELTPGMKVSKENLDLFFSLAIRFLEHAEEIEDTHLINQIKAQMAVAYTEQDNKTQEQLKEQHAELIEDVLNPRT